MVAASKLKLPRIDPAVAADGRFMLANSLARPARSIGQFAEEEITLPSGKYRGQQFRRSRMPSHGLWFDLLDSGQWHIHVATGPSQSGKTLCCFVIPVVYCLFEKKEDVIVGLPDMDMSASKWQKDIRPVIAASKYAAMLPTSGPGSKGASKIRHIEFRNGTHLTFMSFGGGDKSRAGETAPNLIITETDGGGEMTEASDEASPIEQLIARTLSFDLDAFIVMECTVSTTEGQTWQRYSAGTASRIVRPCPKCGVLVTPEREHFGGWQGADNEIDAGDSAAFHCPSCGKPWTDEERFKANQQSQILHRGQTIDDEGSIAGELPKTRTLGFRWSAVDNTFRSSKMLGSLEWQKAREVDQEAAQKSLDQFHYAIPWKPDDSEDEYLDPYTAMKRIGTTQRNMVPIDHDVVTVGTDIGDRKIHWTAIAWCSDDATCRVINYGVVQVFSQRLGPEKAILAALRYMRDRLFANGFPVEQSADSVLPLQWWIDAGWRNKVIYGFAKECQSMDAWKDRVYPAVGRGAGTQYRRQYTEKLKTDRNTPYVGDDFYFSRLRKYGVNLTIVNADAWKSFVHARMMQPIMDDQGELQPGAMTLFIPEGGDHSQFCRHLAAERETTVFIPDKGEIKVWKTVSRANHFFDATYMACAAGRFCGVELITVQPTRPVITDDTPAADDTRTPDGRPFYDGMGIGGPY
jgi:phage terminase large subunit GpA-like protein